MLKREAITYRYIPGNVNEIVRTIIILKFSTGQNK